MLLSREQIDAERRRHPRAARAVPRLRRAPRTPRASSTTPTGSARSICSSFLRDAGKHFTVNYMLQKESVNRRLESEEGISFTEFSYLLLQAYDFLQLFDRYGCTLQMGGSDQWGNITAGIDLIRKLRGEEGARPGVAADEDRVGREVRQDRSGHDLARSGAHVAVPLLSVLAEHRRSRRRAVPEVLHVPRPRDDRRARRRATQTAPEKREAQRVLAREVTTLVHGAEQVARAEHASSAAVRRGHHDAAGGRCAGGVRGRAVDRAVRASEFDGDGIGVVDLVARVQLAPSKSEARRLVQSGGVYVNNRRVADPQARLTREQAIGGRLFVLRKGQKQNHRRAADLTGVRRVRDTL